VDEGYPANSFIYKGAFGRPIMQPWHGLPECTLQISACFSLVHDEHCSVTMAEYHMAKIQRGLMKAHVADYTNGCPK